MIAAKRRFADVTTEEEHLSQTTSSCDIQAVSRIPPRLLRQPT